MVLWNLGLSEDNGNDAIEDMKHCKNEYENMQLMHTRLRNQWNLVLQNQ